MRQGLLSEPEASSGPAAMLLAVSRSPSSIPRRSPCPDRCHLPLAFLSPSPHKTSTASTTASTPGPMPPFSGVPLNPTHKAAPRTVAASLWCPSQSQQKKRHPAVPTLPDTGTKTPVKQTYTIYNQHSPSAQINYHQKVLSATQDRWPAL